MKKREKEDKGQWNEHYFNLEYENGLEYDYD